MDVAVTPDGLDRGAVAGSTVLVIDVLRASTCIVTALANGCAGIVPVGTPEEARVRQAALPGEPGARATAAAEAATAAARPYGKDIARLAHDSSWARHLASRGRAADVAACLSLDAAGIVPVYRADIDKVVAACG